MVKTHRVHWLLGLLLVAAAASWVERADAADPAASAAKSGGDPFDVGIGYSPLTLPGFRGVDIFDAMRHRDIGVQFIARDSREATLILTNNTDKPLSIRVPEAFAAIPVLAQPPLGGAATGRTTSSTSKQPQPLGSGSQGATQGQRQGAVGGAFSIPPERVVKLKVPTVCLEYGKPEPNAHVQYTIVPIETCTASPEVQELCRLLGTASVDEQSAQAAAWHLANHLSWDQLADMKQFPHNRGFTRPVFTADQIHAAMALTDKVIKLADARATANSSVHSSVSAVKTAGAE